MCKLVKIISAFMLMSSIMKAQTLYNNGATIQTNPGATLFVNGNLNNNAGSNLRNFGVIELKGDLSNNQVMSNLYPGSLVLSGSTAQTLSGSSDFITTGLTINNSNQINNNNTTVVYGECKFINGIVNAPLSTEPLLFRQSGFVSNTNPPGNTCHVDGYVGREGIGSFDYPVGDGSHYQKIGTNLTSNPGGMRVKYNASDAGSGPFSNAGTSTTLLNSYNTLEHWYVQPLSTASGNVTVYWDTYNNPNNPQYSLNRVAHQLGVSWLNEGTFATGNASGGYVVSNTINNWGNFTIGTINAAISSTNITLNLKFYIEGYYQGSSFMRPVTLYQNVSSYVYDVDTVTVELRPALLPGSVAHTFTGVLQTDGSMNVSFNNVYPGQYYLVLKHRNGLETWSSTTLDGSIAMQSYDFSTAANKAYGSNQVEVEPGVFAIYSGDLNGDENIDLLDLGILETDINNFEFGYRAADINGDGNVDLLDSPITELNINNFTFSVHP